MRILLIAALATLVGCTRGMTTTEDPAVGRVDGTLIARDPGHLTAWSQTTITLVDTSGEQGPVEIASILFQGIRVLPMPFTLEYEKAEIDPSRPYALEARVMLRGSTIFEGTLADVALGDDAPPVELELVRTHYTDPFLANVVGSDWSVATLDGKPILADTSILLRFTADGKLAGRAQNRYGATYEQADSSIQVSPPAATRMYLDTPIGAMDQESAFLTMLEDAVSWSVDGDALTLTTSSGATITLARVAPDE